MAGQKETPRQKMIGMMYLVLTALLALNVSSETLQKFVYLNESLERQVDQNTAKNANVVQRIETTVDEAGNREQDVAVLDKARQVREATNKVIEYTNELKEKMIEVSGGLDEDGNLMGAQDMDKIANFMINKKENGIELKNTLNEYAAYLSNLLDEEFSPIAYDGKDHPVYKNDKEQKRKNFATLTFESTPTAACLASVSQFQTEIMAYESRALEGLARQVGAGDVKFDVITPMVRPKSNIVAAGTKYEAEMFIAASSSGITPTMAVNGSSIPVVGGKGRVEFTASGGGYDNDGLAKKTYEAAITIKLPGGKDSTFTQQIEYFVAKPVIQIQSAAVQALYLNCGNELQVNVPALGSAYNPSFSAKGGNAIPGSKKGLVTIVPQSSEVTLSVSSAGTYIGSEKFNVRRIPMPKIVPMTGGKPVDLKTGVSAPGPRSLTLQAVADESFAQFLPKDARYRVVEYDVFLGRGSRPVDQFTSTSQTVNLSRFAQKARPGDRIVVEVKKVQRMNFRNQIEDVRMGTEVFTIPLN